MPGRTPMNASIGSGLRRTSLLRSAALRSGLATSSAMRSRLIGPEAGTVDWHAAARAVVNSATANSANERLMATRFMAMLLETLLKTLLETGRGRIMLQYFSRENHMEAAPN